MNTKSTARSSSVDRFYELLWELEKSFPYYSFSDPSSWRSNQNFPRSGVYFVFEDGELRSGKSDWHRVTRIGTHWVSAVKETSTATLSSRLNNHYGRKDGGRGDSSIFRVHIGSAFTGDSNWSESGEATAGDTPMKVSSYMREHMRFVILPIDDEPSKNSLRRKIEKGAISLLSNYNSIGEDAVDPPSIGWLGQKCVTKRVPHNHVSQSGLWNVDGVSLPPDTDFLFTLESCIRSAKSSAASIMVG